MTFLGLIQQYFRMADKWQNEEVKEVTSKKLTIVAFSQRVVMCLDALSLVSGSTSSVSFFPACAAETHTLCFCHGNYGLRHGRCSYAEECFHMHIEDL